jgi:hypothetical protein
MLSTSLKISSVLFAAVFAVSTCSASAIPMGPFPTGKIASAIPMGPFPTGKIASSIPMGPFPTGKVV